VLDAVVRVSGCKRYRMKEAEDREWCSSSTSTYHLRLSLSSPSCRTLQAMLDISTSAFMCRTPTLEIQLMLADPAYDKAWVSTLNAHPSLGSALAGWHPKRLSVVDGTDIYWAAYKATKSGKKSD